MNTKTSSATAVPATPAGVAVVDARKLTAQLRAAERDAAKARGELRALKAAQQTAVAQAEAKATLLDQQLKKTNAKAVQVAKQWKGERADLFFQKNVTVTNSFFLQSDVTVQRTRRANAPPPWSSRKRTSCTTCAANSTTRRRAWRSQQRSWSNAAW